MKKLALLLGAVLLTGAALTSCGGSSYSDDKAKELIETYQKEGKLTQSQFDEGMEMMKDAAEGIISTEEDILDGVKTPEDLEKADADMVETLAKKYMYFNALGEVLRSEGEKLSEKDVKKLQDMAEELQQREKEAVEKAEKRMAEN